MTTTLTTGVIIDSTSATINTGVVTDGILSGSDFKTSQSVTARAEFVDSKASTKGNVVFFEANDDDMYLFIQVVPLVLQMTWWLTSMTQLSMLASSWFR